MHSGAAPLKTRARYPKPFLASKAEPICLVRCCARHRLCATLAPCGVLTGSPMRLIAIHELEALHATAPVGLRDVQIAL